MLWEQLERLVRGAQDAGYIVRHEYFGGTGGGLCEVAGKKVLFLDLALSAADQLDRLKQLLQDRAD